ncbi:hypothetical protein REPUB_Repub13aG0126300 [Reevesia pubescens]
MAGGKVEFSLREIKSNIGGGRVSGSGREKLTSSFDLVEQMQFLFVRIVRARDLPLKTVNRIIDPFVEVKVGNYKATTKYFEKKPNLEWNQVFAFTRDRIQTTSVEITVRDKELRINENMIGKLTINLPDIPTCLPPDSPLASQWFRLEDKNGVNVGRGELMLAIWFGIQADDVFPDAWHSDATIVSGESLLNTRSKVYLSPRLWYLRVNIIQAQDLVPSNKNRKPEVYVKAIVGDVILRTRVSADKNVNPKWNEDLMLVVAEPFRDPLILSVEDMLGNNMVECLGRCVIRLSQVDQRMLPLAAAAKWFNLEKIVLDDGRRPKELMNFYSKLNMRVTLDNGYHVFDESIHYGNDYRPTMKKPWTAIMGVLELGILSASSLQPMKLRDGRETTDSYCVAKYGPKWVKTRTVVDSFAPKWNEQYTWELEMEKIQVLGSEIRRWKNGTTTIIVISLYCIVVIKPHLILPTMTLYCLQVGICGWWKRPRHPTHIDVKLSLADAATADELDEEFDTFPSSRQSDVLRMRYDRLRSIAGRVMSVISDIATQAERFHSLLN